MECPADLRRLPHSTPEVLVPWGDRSSTCWRPEADAIFFQPAVVLEMAFRNSESRQPILHRDHATRRRPALRAEWKQRIAEPGRQHADRFGASMGFQLSD